MLIALEIEYLAVGNEGEILEYLGVVREERHLVRIDELKYKRSSWEEFLKSVGLN